MAATIAALEENLPVPTSRRDWKRRPAMINSSMLKPREDGRITSYNVCYTKLLRLLADGATVDAIPLSLLIGPCLVVDLRGHGNAIDDGLLRRLPLGGQQRLLFHTDNSALWDRPGS